MTDTIAIPTGSTELAELLADDAKRNAVFADPDTTKEFLANYLKAANKGNALEKDLNEAIQAGVMDFLKANGVEGRPDQATLAAIKPTGSGAVRNASYNPKAPGVVGDGKFSDLGDFTQTVWHKNPRPDAVKLGAAHEIQNAYSSGDPTAGGFLIPEEFRSEIMQLALEQSVVRPRATVITMGTATQSIPFVDATTHSGSLFGGMTFDWTPESAEITASNAKFGRVKFEANKLTGGARIPNELLADSVGLSSWFNMAAPQGLAFHEDLAFLEGSGVGQPLGVYEAAAAIEVAKETNQAADSVVPENIFKMFSRMLPQSMGSAVWLVNQTVLPELLGLTIAVGTGGAPIGLVNVHASPVMTMLGRPLLVTEKNPAVGDAGDVAFVDFRYYLIGDRQAVSIESSEHSRFMNDETEIRIIVRVDGRPWIQSALTPNKGSTVSPIVKLAARA